jgi:serine/threonine protein kinase
MKGRVVLGKYKVGSFLGRGSMGEVFLAHPVAGGADVVVKFMSPKSNAQPRFRELFGREMQTMARFRHPHAVQLLDASLDDPAGPCIVMEYVPGTEMDTLLENGGRIDAERMGRLVVPLCQALHAAHTAGIIHRDLKPANIKIIQPNTPEETVKVMDLGLAALADKPHISLEKLQGSGHTHAVGTPAYLCPEQIRGDDSDARADIYSLGVTLFEALTGQLPFNDDSIPQLLKAHVHREPPKFASLGVKDVPPGVEAVVRHCLEKYPYERPQTAFEVAMKYMQALGSLKALSPGDFQPLASGAEIDVGTAAAAAPTTSSVDRIVHSIEAWMPEAIAVMKIRGFLDDLGAKLISSDPGLIQVQIGNAKKRGGWLSGLFGSKPAPGDDLEGMAVDLHMTKKPGNNIDVTAVFRAIDGPLPADPRWHKRAKQLFNELRGYLMAKIQE